MQMYCQQNNISFPIIPSSKDGFTQPRNPGLAGVEPLNQKVTFFGCSGSGPTNATIIVYNPNRSISFASNIADTTGKPSRVVVDAMIENGFYQLTGSLSANFTDLPTCLGCAAISSVIHDSNAVLEWPQSCRECFQKYCYLNQP